MQTYAKIIMHSNIVVVKLWYFSPRFLFIKFNKNWLFKSYIANNKNPIETIDINSIQGDLYLLLCLIIIKDDSNADDIKAR